MAVQNRHLLIPEVLRAFMHERKKPTTQEHGTSGLQDLGPGSFGNAYAAGDTRACSSSSVSRRVHSMKVVGFSYTLGLGPGKRTGDVSMARQFEVQSQIKQLLLRYRPFTLCLTAKWGYMFNRRLTCWAGVFGIADTCEFHHGPKGSPVCLNDRVLRVSLQSRGVDMNDNEMGMLDCRTFTFKGEVAVPPVMGMQERRVWVLTGEWRENIWYIMSCSGVMSGLL